MKLEAKRKAVEMPRRNLSGQAVLNSERSLATQPTQLLYRYNMNPSYAKRKIKEAMAREEKGAEVMLYGSRARGTANLESDWDILVLLDKPEVSFKDEQRIRHSLYELELELQQPISIFAYARDEWTTNLCETPLYQHVIK